MKLRRIFPSSKIARTAVSLAVLASLVAISVIVTGATGGATEDPMDRDAQAYATRYGTTLKEATRRLNLQDTVGDLEEQLVSNESDTFAGLWIQHEPEYKVVVNFTENGDSTISSYVNASDLKDLVEVRAASNTLVALQQARTTAKTTGNSVNTKTESDINVFENKVELFVLDKANFESRLTEEGIALPDVVQTIEVPRFSKTEANIYGGLHLTPCTAGFSVKNNIGDKGITTAEHCGETAQYNILYNGDALDYQEGLNQGSLDVGWYTTPGYTPINRIKDGHGGRSITGEKHRNNQSIGTNVCKYGKITGYTCGEIISKWFDPPGNYNATWMRVHNPDEDDLSASGDSGGPWFVGTKAYGIHHGAVDHYDDYGDTGIDDAIYMAVNYFANLSIEVLAE